MRTLRLIVAIFVPLSFAPHPALAYELDDQERAPSELSAPAQAGAAMAAPSGTGLPLRPERRLAFTTNEGTWMSVDVSPDGRRLVLDHLGDLYLLPVQGGQATRLLGGMAMDSQPRFSPSGRHVAFVSDRSGRSAIWTVALDGSGLRQISPDAPGSVYAFRQPVWAPDGQHVVAFYTNLADGGTAIMRFAVDGREQPVTLFAPDRATGFTVFANPSFGRDGRYLYFASSRRPPGPGTGDDPLGGRGTRTGQFTLARLDMRTNEIVDFATREGGAFAPLVTRSGRALIYGTRDYRRSETILRRYDLATSADRVLTRPVQTDLQEMPFGNTIPAYATTPDDRALIVSHDGRLWRVDMASGAQTEIPFTIDVALELGPLARFQYRYDDRQVTVRGPTAPALSPDGQTLAFGAVGAIWLASTNNGEMRRLTPPTHRAVVPAWSPDGLWVAYSTWDPASGDGRLWRVRVNGGQSPLPVASRHGPYNELLYSPDGSALLALASRFPTDDNSTLNRRELDAESPGTVLHIPLDGGPARTVTQLRQRHGYGFSAGGMHLAGSDGRLYFRDATGRASAPPLMSVRLDGTDRREALPSNGYPVDQVISPDGSRVLRSQQPLGFTSGITLWNASHDAEGHFSAADARPVSAFLWQSFDIQLHWSADGRSFWGFQDMRFVRYELAAFERDPQNYRPFELDLSLRVPAARPSGSILLRGGRIITMRGDEIIENGDILVTENRIAALGPRGSVRLPDSTTIIDVTGRTILPGYVDIHSHDGNSRPERARAAHMAEIAYGVTAIRDPSPMMWPVTQWADIAAGLDIGPRAFSTGPALRNLDLTVAAPDSYLDAMTRRYSQGMQSEGLKEYRSGGRALRQRLLSRAHHYGLTPTNESFDDFWDNLSLAVDGYGGIEHMPQFTPFYDDVAQLLARSRTVLTPTLAAAGPDVSVRSYASYLLSSHDLNRDARFQRFVPRIYQYNHPSEDYRVLTPDRYRTPGAAASAASVVRAGGTIGLGSHGDVSGIGAHLELWALASGGMPLHDVLRVGTIFGADAIGHRADFGSLEPGKLADLQVLDRNPLDDIRNTTSISMVMANGFLYDAASLDRIWPDRRPLPRQWWQE